MSNAFQLIYTEDGSPTLRPRAIDHPLGWGEAMHSLKGAFAETLYIYGEAFRRAEALNLPARVFSLGLGLGYNEIMAVADSLKRGIDLKIESYEADDFLRSAFMNWVEGRPDKETDWLQGVYNAICESVAQNYALAPELVRSSLRKMLQDQRLHLHGPLLPTTKCPTQQSIILYDAFSAKTTPELWSEPFLVSFLTATADASAVFSTYACTGTLKRALATAGFTVEVRAGFASKRHSTFAFRFQCK